MSIQFGYFDRFTGFFYHIRLTHVRTGGVFMSMTEKLAYIKKLPT